MCVCIYIYICLGMYTIEVYNFLAFFINMCFSVAIDIFIEVTNEDNIIWLLNNVF